MKRFVLLAASASLVVSLEAQDWPQWRGPARDGVITSFVEPTSWPDALKQRWKIDVGLGYATPVLVADRVYMFSRQGEDEVLAAIEAASGKVIWRSSYRAPFAMLPATAPHGPGPKSTPTFAGGRIFTLGMTNIVTAFDAASGKQLWQKPATKEQPRYHTAMSPLVDGDRVIVHVGGPGDAQLAAFSVATGEARWSWRGDSPAYGSPVIAELGGTRQLITYTHKNLVGLSAADGQLLWQRPFATPSDTSAQTPIVFRDLLIQTGRENGVTAFRVNRVDGKWTTEDVWQTREVSLHMTNGVVADGVLYGLSHLNSGQYFAVDLTGGRVLWKSNPRQADNAAIVRAGNTLFLLEDDGELVVVKADRTGFNPLRRYEVATSATWAQPAISRDRLFVKDVSTLALWTLN